MPVVTTKYPNQVEEKQPQQADPNLPYAQEGQLLNVVKPMRQPTQNTAANGGNAVLATAQQSALSAQNQPNPTMGLVQQGVQKVLQNPLGYDPKKYQQNQLEQYDRNRASAMLGYQQATADVMNTGINREKAYNYAMQGAQGRSDLENQLAMEQATKEREAMLAALSAGQNVVQTQSGLDEAAFNRLIQARGAGEGQRTQESEQTFQGAEAEKQRIWETEEGNKNRVEQARQFDTEAEFKEWATEGGWKQDDIARAWQSVENEKTRVSTEKIASWNIDLEKWKTDETAKLTKEGWSVETANLKIKIDADALQSTLDRELNKYIADNNLSLEDRRLAQNATQFSNELEFKRWATQAGIDDNVAGRAWEAGQNALKIASQELMQREALSTDTYNKELDRSLTLSVESGRLAQADRELAQQAMLATSELEFKRWATEKGFDETWATQAWQAGENAKDRAQTMVIANNQLSLETQKLVASIDQFAKTYGLESSKYMTGIDQWQQEFGQKVQEWESATGIQKQQLAQELQIANSEMANRIVIANIDAEARAKGQSMQAVLDTILGMDMAPDVAANVLIQEMNKVGLDTTGIAESLKTAQNAPVPIVVGQSDVPELKISFDGKFGDMAVSNGQTVKLEDNFTSDFGTIPSGKYTVLIETSNPVNAGHVTMKPQTISLVGKDEKGNDVKYKISNQPITV